MASQKIGWRAYVDPGLDVDAKAFITAAGINNTTQISAINTLVIQLKFYGIWSKMKALYPMVGGSSTSHKFNLKDPRDLDAAYRLVFNGGWTHAATGAKPDGTTGYADTKMNLFTTVGGSSLSHSTYVRLNSFKGAFGGVYSPVLMNAWYDSFVVMQSISNTSVKLWMGNTSGEGMTGTVTSLGGMIMGNRNGSSTVFTLKKNDSTINTSASFSVRYFPSIPYYIGAYNNNGAAASFDDNEIAFYHIGDGLSDVEAANFYTAIQTFQTTLGRNIGTAITTVSDSSAVAFIAAAGITDATQKAAINGLVTDLKSAGVWTKLKAVYPFVGGSATTHKWNLKDPRDANDAYRLVFSGGWTHASTGAKPNGTTGYAETYFMPSTLALYNAHLSYYSRTNSSKSSWTSEFSVEKEFSTGVISSMTLYAGSTTWAGAWITSTDSARAYEYVGRSSDFFIGSRTSVNNIKIYRNGLITGSSSIAANLNGYLGGTQYPAYSPTLGARKKISTANAVSYEGYSDRESAFASIGDGLTDSEALALYAAVQRYQTILGRQVGTPLLSSGQVAGLLDTYYGAAAAYSFRKLRAGYYGSAIRVRRSNDNTEKDIAFDSSGNLDTASLTAFVGAQNLSTYSDALSGSGWYNLNNTMGSLGITTNATTAPDGNLTATQITENGWGVGHTLYYSNYNIAAAGISWNTSVHVKKGTGTSAPRYFALTNTNALASSATDIYAIFDLNTGTVISSNFYTDTNTGYSMTSVGNGWFRCSIWGTTTTATSRPEVKTIRFINNSSTMYYPGYIGTANADLYVWGFQYSKGSNTDYLTLKAYNKTTTVAAGDAYVTTWYDQSGNGNNRLMTTATYQPSMVTSGFVNYIDTNKPGMYFQSSALDYASPYIAEPTSVFVAFKMGPSFSSTGDYPLFGGNVYEPQNKFSVRNNKYYLAAAGSDIGIYSSGTASANTTCASILFAATDKVRINGAEVISGNVGNISSQVKIGWSYMSNKFFGYMSEFIIYSSDKSTDFTGIESNVKSYYAIS